MLKEHFPNADKHVEDFFNNENETTASVDSTPATS